MKLRLVIPIAAFAVVAVVFYFSQQKQPPQCQDSIGCVRIGHGNHLKLGIIQTQGGGSQSAGEEQIRAIKLALHMRNYRLLGYPVQLIPVDDGCSQEGGAVAALKLISDPEIIGIFGTNCSAAAVTASRIMSVAGMVMISSSNSASSLTAIDGNKGNEAHPGYYRVTWNDDTTGTAAAHFAFRNLARQKAAVISAGDIHTKGLTDIFSTVFKEMGGRIVLDTIIDETEENLSPAVRGISLSGADVLFFSLNSPVTCSNLIHHIRTNPNLKNLVLIGCETMMTTVFLKSVGNTGVGTYIAGPKLIDSRDRAELAEQYRERYGEYPPSFYYSYAFDAFNLLSEALQKVAVKHENQTLCIGRAQLRETLYNTRNQKGISGILSCNEYGECGSSTIDIIRLDDPAKGLTAARRNVVFTAGPAFADRQTGSQGVKR